MPKDYKGEKTKPSMALIISVGPKMPKKPQDTATPDDKAMKKAWDFMKQAQDKMTMDAIRAKLGLDMPESPEGRRRQEQLRRAAEDMAYARKLREQSFGLGPGAGSNYERAIYEDRFEDDEPAFPDTSGDMEGMSANERALFLAQQSMERPERTTPSIHSDLTPEQLANYRAKIDRLSGTGA